MTIGVVFKGGRMVEVADVVVLVEVVMGVKVE
jgi:hypothetical protein